MNNKIMVWFKRRKELEAENQELREALKQKPFFDSPIKYNKEELRKSYNKVFNGGTHSKIVMHDLFLETMIQTRGVSPHFSSDYRQGQKDVMIRIMLQIGMGPDSIPHLVKSVVDKQA